MDGRAMGVVGNCKNIIGFGVAGNSPGVLIGSFSQRVQGQQQVGPRCQKEAVYGHV